MALSAGHTVNAGVHGNNNLKAHPQLNVIKCDATNETDIKNLINSQDAVVSFIGHVKNSPDDVQSKSIKNTINAMNSADLKRLVSLTGTGVRMPGDKITLIDRILNLSISVIDPARVKDGKQHFEIIESSKVDWTVIRVLKLQNTKAKLYKLSLHGPTKPYISRTEVAKAFLEVLENNSFIQQSPIICNV